MSRQKKTASTGNRRGSDKKTRHGYSTSSRQRGESAATQRARLLAYLKRRGNVSTLEARGGDLRIMHPGGRVYELRQAGFEIICLKDERQGCGRYYLRGGVHAE